MCTRVCACTHVCVGGREGTGRGKSVGYGMWRPIHRCCFSSGQGSASPAHPPPLGLWRCRPATWADVGHAILSSSFTVTCSFSRFIPPLGPRAGCPRQGCFSTQAPVGSMCNSPLSWTRGLTEAGLAAVRRRDLGVPRPCGVAPSQPTLSVTPVLCVWRSGRGGHGPATRRVPGVHGGGERRLLWWPPRRERGRSRARPSPSASILSLSDIVHGGFSHCF